ncbi:MAG: DUF2339 domain-containing protein [Gammaproteobacteria bacterium]|nr:MAG: DUF2339 domain-containing protein [Gammaproteobacteria bacterium]
MVLIGVSVLIGIVAGALWLGHAGWLLGAVLGALAGVVVKLSSRIRVLESALKTLDEDQAITRQQLKLLKDARKIFPAKENELSVQAKDISLEVFNQAPPVSAIDLKSQPSPDKNSAEHTLPDEKLETPVFHSTPENKPVSASAPKQPTLAKVAEPREPDLSDKIALAVRKFFTEGNPIVRIGMVVMFFGVSFLVKYASGQGLFPIEFRLTGIVVGAIALLVFGWRTRLRPGAYGLVLQGGGVAIIYLTLFAAAKIYGLIPLAIAFGILFLVVMLGVLLALLQNAQVLALLATAGGFLAPILTSSGSGSHVGLFSFYLILNIGILSIAVYKAWRLLNWVGFMFTFVITAAWGVLKYDPSFYSTTQPFLIAFFILYLAVSILFSFKQPTNLKGMVDGSLVFGLPLVAFGLQTLLLKDTEHGLAISAVTLAAIYILIAVGLAKRYMQTHCVLIESFLALGVSFATLAVPLALDASWTSVTWALEATGLVWIGLRQARLRTRVVGYLLHCASVVSLLVVEGIDTGPTPILSGDFLGLTLLALSSITIAYMLHYFESSLREFEKVITLVAVSLGILWWFLAGLNEISVHILVEYNYAASVVFATLSAIALVLTSKKLDWSLLGKNVFALLPLMGLLSLVAVIDSSDTHPSQVFSLAAIIFFFVFHYRFLFKKERDFVLTRNNLLGWWHVFSVWYLFLLIFWETFWQENNLQLSGTADLMIWFAAITLPVVVLIAVGHKKSWPFNRFEPEYKNWIPAPLFILMALWFVSVCDITVVEMEQYLPLLNPLDLAQFAIVLIFAYALKQQFMHAVHFISRTIRLSLLGIMLFVWVNVVTLRAMSHYLQIPYLFDSIWNAEQVQMALSILWSVCALLIMNLSRRVQRRELWMIGAGLLGLVVFKLATKDISGSGTLARILSFMVVGALMLLIGFLSPIPAKKSVSPEIKDDDLTTTDGLETKEATRE